jgi:hypothetical protein
MRPNKRILHKTLIQRNTRWPFVHIVEALVSHPMGVKELKFAVNAEGSGGLRKKGMING